MSTKNIIITQITNFIDELVNTYPTNNELVLFREKYNLLRSANSQLIINYFIQYIYPHKDIIKKEDENFFLDGGGQEELNDKNGLKFRDNIKQLWQQNMSEENKKIVGNILKLLYY